MAAGTITINTTTGLVQPNSITFNPAGSGNCVITGGSINLPGAATPITVNTNATIASSLVGAGGFSVSGGNVLTLSGSGNTYAGQTLLRSGTIAVNNVASINGLYEGLVNNNNSFDLTSAIPHTSIQSVAQWALPTTMAAPNIYPSWANNTTWGYSTYIDNTTNLPVTYSFGKNFDDNASLVIDGVSVINNTTWNQNLTGQITLGPGLHSVDLRFGQGTGGVGPNTGAYGNFGISYNTVNNTGTDGTWNQMGGADAVTQFQAIPAGAPNSQMVMSSNTTLDLSTPSTGLVALGSLADGPGATGHQVLLGGNTLDTGLDNASTTFSGAISGDGGSLVKSGSGVFSISGAKSPIPAARASTRVS